MVLVGMIERFWHSIKYEDIHLQSYETPRKLGRGVRTYLMRYNAQWSHKSIGDLTLDRKCFENI